MVLILFSTNVAFQVASVHLRTTHRRYYSVEVSEADIKLSIPNALAEGGWAFDPAKTITFPSNVELNKVVQVILDDYATHSR